MRHCQECGRELRPSTRHMRVFSAMRQTTQLRVEADECPHCGRLYPADGAVESVLRSCEATTLAPPPM